VERLLAAAGSSRFLSLPAAHAAGVLASGGRGVLACTHSCPCWRWRRLHSQHVHRRTSTQTHTRTRTRTHRHPPQPPRQINHAAAAPQAPRCRVPSTPPCTMRCCPP
jgi:hypothetical protein